MIFFDKTPEIKGDLIKIYCFSGKVRDLKIYLREVIQEEKVRRLH
ncbi:hypothetical protein [Natronincola ferrireducens]|uniref:Uncharacterized protein n=1 Tax=Natronincola ferrireducens TaxID=393762 RepID=A0A1G9I2H5_9FIRM|nr:hypothetical protein [Natronincola ferrireducens]SDL19447.1 hypothetical protein SAMN05660472_02779 [Natronincola ferrireducens]